MGSKNPVLGGVGSLKERGNLGTYFTMEYLACDILNLFGIGGSSDAAFNCQYCSNLSTAVTASVYNYY